MVYRQGRKELRGGGSHSLTPLFKAFTLAEVFYPAEQSKRIAFTLAEVLITLGIIGVIAALSMPSLVQIFEKNITEAKLKIFYSKINQAIKLSEIDNGPIADWNLSEPDIFYNQYLDKYIKTIGRETYFNFENVKFHVVIFPDGTAMGLRKNKGYDVIFFISAKNIKDGHDVNGRNVFTFNLRNNWSSGMKTFFEPYTYIWDGTEEHLKNNNVYGCNENNLNRSYCTKLIQLNGWKIPQDYPIKF